MPSTGTDSPRGNLDLVAKIAAVALLYTIVGKLGLMLDAVSGFATLVWPASGLALAALLLFGNRLWPGVWLGAFIVNLWTGAPWLVAVAIAAGNTLEAVIGSHVFRRWAEFDGRFDRLRHVAGLIVPAAMLSTLASATVGVASLAFAGVVSAHAIVPTWRAWWIGDVLGDLLVAPLLLTWARPATVVLKPLRRAELVLLGAALVGASLAVFFRPRTSVVFPLEGPYILFPLFIWAAVRFELRGAATATVLASAFAIWGTVVGRGPFARASLAESLLALQTFMGCAALTPLVVGGAISDRARLQREAEHARAEALLHSERLQVLADASAALVRVTQDAEAILRETAHYCAELVGDACFILLLSEQDGNLDVVAFHHEDPEYRAFAERLVLGRHLGGSPFCHSVMESASLVILPSVEPHAAAELIDPAFGELVERYPIHGLIAVPLMQRERVTGVVGLARHVPQKPYNKDSTSLLRDLVERAGLALDNAALYRELNMSVQLRDDFLAMAGHELKTPLTALLLQIQSVQRFAADPSSTRLVEGLAKAERAALRIERLIDQLLDVSRITAGRLRLEPELVDLTKLVKEVVAQWLEANAHHRDRTSVEVTADAPVHGQWDRLRLEQVVNNLIGNALKYGSGKPVDVVVRVEEGDAVLRVTDHGVGIDEEHQKRIFQRFERAVSARHFGGFGLGLWIARQIVQASGGEIGVASALGRGSTFTVRLPITDRGDSASPSPPTSGDGSRGARGAERAGGPETTSDRVPQGPGARRDDTRR